jgi:cytochrome c
VPAIAIRPSPARPQTDRAPPSEPDQSGEEYDMHKLFSIAAAFVAAIGLNTAALANAERGTEAEAQALVKKAVTYYQKNGKDKALAEFQKQPGPFVDRDLYVTVYNMQGEALAHINPKMVGKNMMELRDANGVYLIRERIDAAKKAESGWQEYLFFNPVSKKVEPKRMYWEKHDSIVFAAGAYKQ